MLLQSPEPDLRPIPPGWAVPAGACDTHAHVFAPAGRYPTVPDPAKLPPRSGLAEYRMTLHALGIERAVLVQPDNYGFDNSALLDAIASFEGAARGVVALPLGTSQSEMLRMHGAGIRGVRVSNRSRYCVPMSAIEDIASMIRGLGWHLGLLADPIDLPPLIRIIDRIGVDVVIDHFGRCPAAAGPRDRGFQALLELARHPRCWVKMSAAEALSLRPPGYDEMGPLAASLIEAGVDRLLWGTDWPHGSVTFNRMPMPNDGSLLSLLGRWLPRDVDRRRVLALNPARLFGFPEPPVGPNADMAPA